MNRKKGSVAKQRIMKRERQREGGRKRERRRIADGENYVGLRCVAI